MSEKRKEIKDRDFLTEILLEHKKSFYRISISFKKITQFGQKYQKKEV